MPEIRCNRERSRISLALLVQPAKHSFEVLTFIGFDGGTGLLELQDLGLPELWCHLLSDGDVMYKIPTLPIQLFSVFEVETI